MNTTPTPSESEPCIYELAKTLRELIKDEDHLLNNRIQWFMMLQGILLAALGFAWDKDDTVILIYVFIGLGVAVSFSAHAVLQFYSPAMNHFRDMWDELSKGKNFKGIPPIGFNVPHTGTMRNMRPWKSLPMIFFIAWMGIMVSHATKDSKKEASVTIKADEKS